MVSHLQTSVIPVMALLLTQPEDVPTGKGPQTGRTQGLPSQRLLRTSGSESREPSLWGSKSSILVIALLPSVSYPALPLHTLNPHSSSGLFSFSLIHCSSL